MDDATDPTSEAAAAPKLKAREAFLRRPSRSRPPLAWRLFRRLVELALTIFTVAAAFYDLIVIMGGGALGLLLVSLGVLAPLVAVALWWLWARVLRSAAGRDRADLLAAAAQSLSDVRFSDGSVSDFTPAGFFLLRNGWAMAIDPARGLVRNLCLPKRARTTGAFDWLWGFEEHPFFDLVERPRKGAIERLRRLLGFRPLTVTAFQITMRDRSEAVTFAVEPGYGEAARKLAASANAAIAAAHND